MPALNSTLLTVIMSSISRRIPRPSSSSTLTNCVHLNYSINRLHSQVAPTRSRIRDETLPEIYDVVCVGGGPAGLCLLTALRGSLPF